MNNWCICWFSRIFLLGILIFKGLTERRLYKSFGVKGLNSWTVVFVYQCTALLDRVSLCSLWVYSKASQCQCLLGKEPETFLEIWHTSDWWLRRWCSGTGTNISSVSERIYPRICYHSITLCYRILHLTHTCLPPWAHALYHTCLPYFNSLYILLLLCHYNSLYILLFFMSF
jgi:hypothetical protein